MNSLHVFTLRLMPLWLFFAGLLSGTQFSLNNYPIILILGFAALYRSLWTVQNSWKQSVVYAFSFGYGFFTYSHSWISHPLAAFGDLYTSMQPVVFVAVSAMFAVCFAVVGALNYFIKVQGVGRIFILSMGTLFVEYLRCEYVPAVPLGQVGSVWITYPIISQGASVFGIYGLSFVTILFSYRIGGINHFRRDVLLPFIVFTVCIAWGSWRLNTVKLEVDNYIFRVVPMSLAQVEKYKSLESRAEHLKELVDASFDGVDKHPLLIIWPETTIEFALLQHGLGYDFIYPEIKTYLQHNLPGNTMLLGGIVLRTPKNEAYNSIFGLTKKEDITYIYKKRFLAPFGEFMPSGLRPIAKILGIHAMDDFNRGPKDQSQLILPVGLKINTLICYEGSFSGQVKHPFQHVDLFTVSTNDAWFGYNGKEQQFISHAFRAIEEGVPIIRSANSGFSGYVSPIGTYRVSLSKTPLTIKTHKPLPETPYRWILNKCAYWLETIFSIWLIYIGLLILRKNNFGIGHNLI